jgi:hypothetical protein
MERVQLTAQDDNRLSTALCLGGYSSALLASLRRPKMAVLVLGVTVGASCVALGASALVRTKVRAFSGQNYMGQIYLQITFDLFRMAKETDGFSTLPFRLLGRKMEPVTDELCHCRMVGRERRV